MEAILPYIYTWLVSGSLHLGAGGVVAYLFHDRIAQGVEYAVALLNKLRGV